MSDPFESNTATVSDPGERHFALSVDAGADIDPRPRAIYCEAPGTITLIDRSGTSLAYTMQAGQVLAFRANRVAAISGGTFYGWV